jgi:hypothetical protein
MLPIITGKNKPDIAACVVILQMVGWTLRIVSYKIIAKDEMAMTKVLKNMSLLSLRYCYKGWNQLRIYQIASILNVI